MSATIPGYKPDASELYRCQTMEEFPALLHFLSSVGFNGKGEVVALDVLGRGCLFFENGRIVHALQGAFGGIDAVARMLVWERSEVHLFRRVASPKHEFTCNTNNLIMDATLLADQNAALWKAQARSLTDVPEPTMRGHLNRRLPRLNLGRASALNLSLGAILLLILFAQSCNYLRKPSPKALIDGRRAVGEADLNKRLAARKPHVIGGLNLRMVAIPGGVYEREFDDDETGARYRATVEIPPFWIGRTEVTQVDYQLLMGVNPSAFTGDHLPVENVAWHDARDFCQRLTGIERARGALPPGWEYRLPTEMEWEYALAANRRPDEPTDLQALAWFRDNSQRRTHKVGEKQPNPWGVYDMLGNVNEWCLDWLGRSPFEVETTAADLRACRGGSWLQSSAYCSLDRRTPMHWESANNIIGFRPILAPMGKIPEIAWHEKN